MTSKEKKAFHEALHAALADIRATGALPIEEDKMVDVADVMNDCGDFQRLILAGVDNVLIDTGNGPIYSPSMGYAMDAEANRIVKMTVKELKTHWQVAVSLGVDLGVSLMRAGAKFPGQVVN